MLLLLLLSLLSGESFVVAKCCVLVNVYGFTEPRVVKSGAQGG